MTSIRILWFLLGLLWLVIEIVLARKKKTGTAKVSIAELKSRRMLWVTVLASTVCALVFKSLALSPLPMAYQPRQIIALGFFIAGLGLRYAAIVRLGHFFSTHVTILREHRLITDCPYRYVRHPAYSGLLVALAAAGLAMGDALSLLMLTVPTFIAFNFRVGIEERIMTEQFGQDYRNYCKSTRKFLPWIY